MKRALAVALFVVLAGCTSGSTATDSGRSAASDSCAKFDSSVANTSAPTFDGQMSAAASAADDAASKSPAWLDLQSGYADYAKAVDAKDVPGLGAALAKIDQACTPFRPLVKINLQSAAAARFSCETFDAATTDAYGNAFLDRMRAAAALALTAADSPTWAHLEAGFADLSSQAFGQALGEINQACVAFRPYVRIAL